MNSGTCDPGTRALLLLVVGALGCGEAAPAPADAGRDAPATDAGPMLVEVFADLGASSEGIALGATSGGGAVLYVGTLDDRILEVFPDGTVTDWVGIDDPLGIAVRPDGSLVVCAKAPAAMGSAPGLFAITTDGVISTLALSNPDGVPFGLTNFVALAPDGSLVFSDSMGDRLYRADADGSNVALVTDAITYPNGLAFSADDATLYVASWDTTTLHALSFDAATGAYGTPTPAHEGTLNVDGVVPTAEGPLVLVTSTAGIVTVDLATVSAAAQELVPSRAIPLSANAVFGGAVFGPSELYVTSLSRRSLYVVHTELTAP